MKKISIILVMVLMLGCLRNGIHQVVVKSNTPTRLRITHSGGEWFYAKNSNEIKLNLLSTINSFKVNDIILIEVKNDNILKAELVKESE